MLELEAFHFSPLVRRKCEIFCDPLHILSVLDSPGLSYWLLGYFKRWISGLLM